MALDAGVTMRLSVTGESARSQRLSPSRWKTAEQMKFAHMATLVVWRQPQAGRWK
jgi:hypothetical protein